MSEERRERVKQTALVALGERQTSDGRIYVQGEIVDEVDAAMVLDLVLHGNTMLQIADTLGITYQRALRVYKEALAAVAEQRQDLGELVLQDHLQKLQKVMQGLEEGVEAGNSKSAEAYLRALEQEARLLSLYPDLKKSGTGQVNIQVNFNAFEEDEPDVVVGKRVMDDDND